MEQQKTDRRVKYTLMVIRQSFIKLLRKKPLSKITVKEICEEADINRATFYAHYTDPYDLLRCIENEVIDEINRYLDQYDLSAITKVPVEMLDRVLEYFKENAALFELLLLHSNGDMRFQQEITRLIGERHFSNISAGDMDSKYAYLFFANGAIGVILQWLQDGMKKPVTEISRLILDLSVNGSAAYQARE